MTPIVWSCGLGLNSVAMAVGMVKFGLRYDLAMFADTGGERPETYDYLPILQNYLATHDLPPVMTVWKKNADLSRARTLEEDCLDRKALPSIAYGFIKSCSDHYKIRPQKAVIEGWEPARQAWALGEKVTVLIGFDASEAHRYSKSYEQEKYENRYPLIEWNWDRDDCAKAILEAGLPLPPKSSCFFCPNMGKDEIYALPESLRERVRTLEANADLVTIKGLGRSVAWTDLFKQEMLFDFLPPEKSCDCID